MWLGRSIVAHGAKVPAVFAALASCGAFGTSCWEEETCLGSPNAYAVRQPVGAASLLQHHHHRSHTPASASLDSLESDAQIFPDIGDMGCRVGSSCTAGGIPSSRGACVRSLAESLSDRPNECWDICNRQHLPEAYTTGDPTYDAKLAQAVSSVRAGEYPHMRCPASRENSEASSISSEASSGTEEATDSPNILDIMDSISEAHKAAERARLLTSAAKHESAALGNTGNQEVAEVMRVAAVAESEAADKAKKASEDLLRLSENRKLKADTEEVSFEAKPEEANKKEEGVGVEAAEQAESEEVEPAATADATADGSATNVPEQVEGEATVGGANVSNASGGCCFSFGFGAMMEPCCLSTEQVAERSLCVAAGEEIVGGKTGFTLGSCPASPSDAEKMLSDSEAAEAITVPSMDSLKVPRSVGSNYAFGDPGDTLEELKQKLEFDLEKAKSEVQLRAGEADAKVAIYKKIEAEIAKAAAEPGKEEKTTGDEAAPEEDATLGADVEPYTDGSLSPSMPAPDKAKAAAETAAMDAKEAALEAKKKAAKASSREAKEAVLRVKEAVLVSKTKLQLKTLVECDLLAGQTAKIKKVLVEFDDAIKEAKALVLNGTNVTTEDLVENLSAAAAERRKDAQDSEQAEVSLLKSLEIAQVATFGARAAVAVAKADLEKAEDSNTTSSSESAAASDSSSISEDTNNRAIIEAGSHRRFENWGHGKDKAIETQRNDSAGARSCSLMPDSACVPQFRYQGELVNGCKKELDLSRKAWCSEDVAYVGRWKLCTVECDGLSSATNGTESG